MELESDDILDTRKFSFAGNFDAQVTEILARVRLTRTEVENLQILIDDVEESLSYIWPGCRVHPFGSIITGLGIKTSDIDCYVHIPSYYGFECRRKGPVNQARNQLRKDWRTFTQLFAIFNAKVPIIKFVHIPTGFNCDINFISMSGVKNSKLIAFLLNVDPRALPLAILIKYWSKVYNFTGTNLMPNYGLTMMVIFFLQVKTILPSVAALQKHKEPLIVENWNTAFDDLVVHRTDNNDSLFQLLEDFFNYYKTFNYQQNLISPFMGYPLKRDLFLDLNSVPSEYHLYKANVRSQKCDEIRLNSSLCIQDPFDHSRNCTVAVFGRLFAKIYSHFDLVAALFNETHKNEFLKEVFTMDPEVESEVLDNSKTVFKNKINKKRQQKYVKQKAREHFTRWRIETNKFKGK